MSSEQTEGVLSPEDDAFHRVATDDGSWTETSWFAAQVPSRHLCIWTYPLFRWERGIMSCAIYIWDMSGENPWELPYYRSWMHMPFPSDKSPTSFTLENGLTYSTRKALTSYDVAYEDGEEVSLSLSFDAVHAPKAIGVTPGGHGHIDQLGHVTGKLVLHGEELSIDCYEMRDRTWSPRRESRQGAYVSYSYGASTPSSGFHISKRYSRSSGEFRFMAGFVLGDHGDREVVDGEVWVERDSRGRPEEVSVELELADGGRYAARGEVESRFAMPPGPWSTWACTVRWELPDGSVAYGEHQDTWGLSTLRAATRRGEALPFFRTRE